MPGPFPGMDPYLESARLWRGVHHLLISAINTTLNAALPTSFVARIDERVYIQEDRRNVYPDVAVARRPSPATVEPAVATVERPTVVSAPLRLPLPYQRVREAFVEVFLLGEREQLVSVVEVLSPTNKLPGTGQEEYRRKQRQMRERGINLLEIDLLRDGEHTVLAPFDELQQSFGSWDYLISLYRAAIPDACEAWAIRLRDPLPVIPMPLFGDFSDVPVDLQAVLNRVYDDGAFARSIDYTIAPEPPFNEEDRDWAMSRLQSSSNFPNENGAF
ncbi:MAG: DUF4058 family protein [Armatimonadaceae bacterium]